jgi:hypothetical protein
LFELLDKSMSRHKIGDFLNRMVKWLAGELPLESLTGEEPKESLTVDFCKQTPKILILSGIGYRPESKEDLHQYLGLFVYQKKLVLNEGRYWLVDGL